MTFCQNHRRVITISAVCTAAILLTYSYKSHKNPSNPNTQEIKLRPHPVAKANNLFDIKNFTYRIDSPTCEDILAIFLVTSYFGNVETRSAMRRAFSKENLAKFKFRRIFMLGLAPLDKYTRQNAIENEAARFGDIIQGNFREAYRNLTYKHVMGHKWVSENCPRAKYVIKIDDDMVVNMYKTSKLLQDLNLPPNSMAGYILKQMLPKREPANKWYVTYEEYPGSKYPSFLSGWFYLTTPKLSARIYELSHSTPYFWIDDVYVTGIIAQKLQTKLVDLGKQFTVHPDFLECCMRDLDVHNYDCHVVIGPNGGDNELFYRYNEKMKKCYYEKCQKRVKELNETCVGVVKTNLNKGNALVEDFRLF